MTHYRMDDPNNPPPRDGTLIDLWRDGERFTGRWDKTKEKWFYRCRVGVLKRDGVDDSFFTHWSPIVPPGDEPQEPAGDLFVAEDGGSNFGTWCVFEQVAPGEYEKAGGPFADSEAANAAMARMLAEKEPQESLIRWHGPEVAATWPDGSAVLVDHSEGPRRYCVDLAWNKIEVNAKHAAKWRYALIKRGGVSLYQDERRHGFDSRGENGR